MAQIQKGTTYSTGDQVTAANLNALADAAILLPGAITDQTAKTVPLAADTILLHSDADTALRKSTLTQLFASPQPIGATTANTGAFTTVTATGTISTSGGSLETSRTGAVDAFVRISADAGRSKNLSLNTSGARRWTVSSNSTAESGANAGSDFVLTAYSDADASLGSALTITRSNRSAVFAGGINSTAIGATTASTGAFTTGNFSSTLFAGGVTTLRGANVPIANNSGFLIVGSSDTAAADLGGSLGFTANTTSLSNYPMGNISARLVATGAGAYASYMAFATTDGSGSVAERMRLTSTGLAVTGALSSTGISSVAGGQYFSAGSSGTGAPTFTTRSAGTKVVLYDQISASALPFSLGIDSGTLWLAAGGTSDTIKNYLGTTLITTVSSTGLAVTGNIEGSGVIRTNAGAGTNKTASAAIDYSGGFHRAWCWGPDTSTVGQWKVRLAKSDGTSAAEPITASSTGVAVTGTLSCTGALSKGSGSFRIEHPLSEKSATHQLVHSFIEGPQADLIYRGKVVLVDGKASVNIDAAATMTEGTFEVLCRDVQCFTTNETGWTAVRGKVVGNILTIEAKDADCADEISWMVIGERQDPHMMETDWTDDNGKVIVEPLKPSIESN